MAVTPLAAVGEPRLANADDHDARCELFAGVDMDADVSLSVRRDPDFDALYRLQSDQWQSWVAEVDGKVEGMGTVLVRPGYLDGAITPIGYLGDLRFSKAAEGRQILTRFYTPILQQAAEEYGCDVFLTAIIESNERATRALTVKRRRTGAMPTYTPLMRFNIRSVHLALPRWRTRSVFAIRRASEADLPAIAAFLDRDARGRPFGYPMDEATLRARLRCWPGLRTDSFYLAERPDGTLVGCVAPWDATPVKRMVVTAYRGRMLRTKHLYDAAAFLGRFSPLPNPGEAFRYLYLTHQAIAGDDPDIMRALLEAVYADSRRWGYHFLSCFVPDDDPLTPAYRGFYSTDLPAVLYAVTQPGLEPPAACLKGGRPGFEMALV